MTAENSYSKTAFAIKIDEIISKFLFSFGSESIVLNNIVCGLPNEKFNNLRALFCNKKNKHRNGENFNAKHFSKATFSPCHRDAMIRIYFSFDQV